MRLHSSVLTAAGKESGICFILARKTLARDILLSLATNNLCSLAGQPRPSRRVHYTSRPLTPRAVRKSSPLSGRPLCREGARLGTAPTEAQRPTHLAQQAEASKLLASRKHTLQALRAGGSRRGRRRRRLPRGRPRGRGAVTLTPRQPGAAASQGPASLGQRAPCAVKRSSGSSPASGRTGRLARRESSNGRDTAPTYTASARTF